MKIVIINGSARKGNTLTARATKHGYTFHHSPATVKQYAEGCVKSVSELIDKILKRTN